MHKHDDGDSGSHLRLRARFIAALRDVGVAEADVHGNAVFDRLVTSYGQTHRHYHTLVHVDACLGWLDWLTARAEHPAEVELALWFHDVVYDVLRDDNEQRSADFASQQLRELGVVDATIERIARYILATAHHTATTGDTALLIDIDLAILGAGSADFDRFEQQIRREYAHVPEAAYRQGRARVLQKFLSRPQLYNTVDVRELLEHRARINLRRSLAELSNEGPQQ